MLARIADFRVLTEIQEPVQDLQRPGDLDYRELDSKFFPPDLDARRCADRIQDTEHLLRWRIIPPDYRPFRKIKTGVSRSLDDMRLYV